jgi:hypothetical protein
MNKRAKKRLIEAIKKEKLNQANAPQMKNPGQSKEVQQLPGFLPKPAKKRG